MSEFPRAKQIDLGKLRRLHTTSNKFIQLHVTIGSITQSSILKDYGSFVTSLLNQNSFISVS